MPVVFTTCATYKFDYLSCLKTGGILQREISQRPEGRFGLPLNNNLTRPSYNIASFFKNYNIESRRFHASAVSLSCLSVSLPNIRWWPLISRCWELPRRWPQVLALVHLKPFQMGCEAPFADWFGFAGSHCTTYVSRHTVLVKITYLCKWPVQPILCSIALDKKC